MVDNLQNSSMGLLDSLNFWLNVYAIVLTLIGALFSTKRLSRFWKTRHLRRVWGIKDGDYVVVVCSELDEPQQRQNIEPREFIYSLKYGDVDAFFEVIITLLRLFPKIKLRIMSSGEAQNSKVNLDQHLVLVGGPDYNSITARFLKNKTTQFQYLSPYLSEASKTYPQEIVLFDTKNKTEHCANTDENDFGYFERIRNPNNPENKVVLLGGCHTIGVTAAVKAFSMAESEQGEIPKMVLENAKKLAKRISSESQFSVLVAAERVGQTINTPIVKSTNITVR